MQKILVLAANPKDTKSLRLDEELREIDEGLRRAKHRDRFELCQRHAVRARDVRRAMLDEMPQMVHFSGYGSAAEGLVFEDEKGHSVGQDSLADLIELFADPDEFAYPIRCVVLNGCYSPKQAEAIAQHVSFVIGLGQSIDNDRRIEFAVGFYDALGAGRSVEFAFKFACAAYEMEPDADALASPVLVRGAVPDSCHPPLTEDNVSAAIASPSTAGTMAVPSAQFDMRRWRKVGIAAIVLLPVLFIGYWQGSRVLAARLYQRGERLYEAGDLSSAQANFKQATRFNSNLAEAHFSSALIHEDYAEYEQARSAYTKAKDAGSLGAVNNLARLEIVEFEDYESAAIMLLAAVNSPQRDRTNTELEYSLRKNLGWAWLEQNRIAEARGELLAANQLEQKLPDARPDSYCLLAQAYETQSKTEEATLQWRICRSKVSRPEDDIWKGLANQALSERDSVSETIVD